MHKYSLELRPQSEPVLLAELLPEAVSRLLAADPLHTPSEGAALAGTAFPSALYLSAGQDCALAAL